MKKLVLLLVLVSFLSISCGSTGKTKRVNRIDSNEQADVGKDGTWNRTDFKLASKALISQMISKPWLQKATDKKGGLPDIIIGKLKNKTSDHNVDMNSFKEAIETEIMDSGVLSFVASNEWKDDARDEIDDQLNNSSDDTMKGPGKEAGADYMLVGTVNSINDRGGSVTERYYQITFTLIELGTNRLVWKGQHEITKIVKQKRRTW